MLPVIARVALCFLLWSSLVVSRYLGLVPDEAMTITTIALTLLLSACVAAIAFRGGRRATLAKLTDGLLPGPSDSLRSAGATPDRPQAP